MSSSEWTVYEIEFAVAVYGYVVYQLLFYFFCFEYLILNDRHIGYY